jgi:hypothetical protein
MLIEADVVARTAVIVSQSIANTSHLRRDNILRKCQALDSSMNTDLRGMSHRSHAYHYNGPSL